MSIGRRSRTADRRPSAPRSSSVVEEVVRVTEVCKRFVIGSDTVVAAHMVNLSVGSGEFVCIYGASGSGKTSLLNIVAGLDAADSGHVVVAGQDVTELPEGGRADLRLHSIGVIFQANNLLPEFTAQENVLLPLLIRGLRRGVAEVKADAALATVGLVNMGDRRPSEMSGGQRQRVGIARALAGEQQLLVADEPTGALDSENSIRLFTLLRRVCDEQGTSVLLATHDPLAEPYADAAYTIVDGVVAPR